MSWKLRLAAVAGAMAVSLYACGPAGEPLLSLTAKPRTIDNAGQTATITVTATGADTKPGTGTVRVSAPAGSLKAGEDLTLANGAAETTFSCAVVDDANCKGQVRITAEWVVNGATITSTTTVTVSTPDAGQGGDGGADGGSDGGTSQDAGMRLDGGTFDGGMTGQFRLDVVNANKVALLEGTSDFATITYRLATNTTNPQPVPNTQVSVTLNDGSFAAGSQVLTTTATTDAMGQFSVQVYVSGAARGTKLQAVAAALDAAITAELLVVKVDTLTWKSDSATRTTLTIRSTGQGFTSPVFFELKDPNGMPVRGVDVSFEISANSAAGCTVAPPLARSDANGVVRTAITSGDSQGTATVVATVLGLPPVNSTPFTIVIGQPSDERLSVTCTRLSLGALEWPAPPRTDISTTCRADFTDRNGVRTPYTVAVSWYTEAGQVNPSSTAAANSGFATNMFSTAGSLPVPTNPLPGEPTNGANNPRDNFVTIVASLAGEEQFWDGSGSSAGVTNGKWDPGEYFVDLPEPFADSNDNGVKDPGEPWGDTDRVDCATGQVVPKNGQWDGPNGCWDANTQIWRATHVVYTAALVDNPSAPFIVFNPPLPSLVGIQGSPTGVVVVDFSWFDPWFNRLSTDSASVSVQTISGMRGTVAVSPRLAGESVGHDLNYVTIRATETSPGVFTDDGPCDFTVPDAGYPATRCLRTYKFGPWMTTPSGGRLTFTGATAQAPLPDGGILPPTLKALELRSQNSFQAGPSTYPFSVNFQ